MRKNIDSACNGGHALEFTTTRDNKVHVCVKCLVAMYARISSSLNESTGIYDHNIFDTLREEMELSIKTNERLHSENKIGSHGLQPTPEH